MIEPKTLEEAIQTIKSMQRCGICKHRQFLSISEFSNSYCCGLKYQKVPFERRWDARINDYDACEHWE